MRCVMTYPPGKKPEEALGTVIFNDSRRKRRLDDCSNVFARGLVWVRAEAGRIGPNAGPCYSHGVRRGRLEQRFNPLPRKRSCDLRGEP